jgi:hypothetical protein
MILGRLRAACGEFQCLLLFARRRQEGDAHHSGKWDPPHLENGGGAGAGGGEHIAGFGLGDGQEHLHHLRVELGAC